MTGPMPFEGMTVLMAGVFTLIFAFAMMAQKHMAFKLSSGIFGVIGICSILFGWNMILFGLPK